jgi:hypothetical protein
MGFEVLMLVNGPMLVFLIVGRPEDGGNMLLRNVGIYLQVVMALQRRRPTSTRKCILSGLGGLSLPIDLSLSFSLGVRGWSLV